MQQDWQVRADQAVSGLRDRGSRRGGSSTGAGSLRRDQHRKSRSDGIQSPDRMPASVKPFQSIRNGDCGRLLRLRGLAAQRGVVSAHLGWTTLWRHRATAAPPTTSAWRRCDLVGESCGFFPEPPDSNVHRHRLRRRHAPPLAGARIAKFTPDGRTAVLDLATLEHDRCAHLSTRSQQQCSAPYTRSPGWLRA